MSRQNPSSAVVRRSPPRPRAGGRRQNASFASMTSPPAIDVTTVARGET